MMPTARIVAPPAGWKPVEVLTKSGAGRRSGPAGLDELVVGQHRGLHDHLEHRRVRRSGPDRLDVGLHVVEPALLGRCQVDDHVDLVGAVRRSLSGLGGLHRRLVRTGREPDHRDHPHRGCTVGTLRDVERQVRG